MQHNVKKYVKNILLDKVSINNEGISLLCVIAFLCHEIVDFLGVGGLIIRLLTLSFYFFPNLLTCCSGCKVGTGPLLTFQICDFLQCHSSQYLKNRNIMSTVYAY